MGGWFRKEINSVADLQGPEVAHRRLWRQGDLASSAWCRSRCPARDIYPALEKGTIDAAEWVGPYDDEKLGFYKVAKYYYYPGWWEGGAMLHTMVNMAKWDELPPAYQAIVKAACQAANCDMLANYDAKNPAALKRLVAHGAVLRPFPQDVMEACFDAAKETYAEIGASNAAFKKIHDSMMAFRADGYLWQQVSEATFDNFMMASSARRCSDQHGPLSRMTAAAGRHRCLHPAVRQGDFGDLDVDGGGIDLRRPFADGEATGRHDHDRDHDRPAG